MSITFHEFAHAFAAHLKGDDTAKRAGRLSMNPMVHIDPIGTVLIPLLGIFMHFPLIGWAKPVPVNPNRYKDPENDDYWVSIAGPGSNMLLAILASIMLRLIFIGISPTSALVSGFMTSAIQFLFLMVRLNITLALFNMVPIPPLDGSWILRSVGGQAVAPIMSILETHGFILLLILFYSGVLWQFLGPMANYITAMLLP